MPDETKAVNSNEALLRTSSRRPRSPTYSFGRHDRRSWVDELQQNKLVRASGSTPALSTIQRPSTNSSSTLTGGFAALPGPDSHNPSDSFRKTQIRPQPTLRWSLPKVNHKKDKNGRVTGGYLRF